MMVGDVTAIIFGVVLLVIVIVVVVLVVKHLRRGGSGFGAGPEPKDIGAIVFGVVLLIIGLVTLNIPEIPVVLIGALIFGPIILFYGIIMAIYHTVKKSERPSTPLSYPTQTQYPTTRMCPKCGAVIAWDSTFCTKCGNQIGGRS